jgi:transcriptional regulator GlxA family with amidase domain
MADLLEGKEVGSVTVDPLLHERESSLRAASGVERALAWLKSHPDAAISAGELARLAGMSRRSFEMALRAARDISPGELLRSMRQSRAEKLLRETQLDIAAIGRDCGYPEAAAFSAAFKRWTGRSPRDFRAASVG